MSTERPNRIRWYNSLIVRICVLCVVLLLCLLGSVYVMTAHYYQQVSRELELRAQDLANNVEVWLEEHPEADIDFETIPDDLMTATNGIPVELALVDAAAEPSVLAGAMDAEGYVFMATQYFPHNGNWVQVTARFHIDPQTEVVRAFKNRNLAAIGMGFVVTLGLMIYLIARALQPLRELSDSCAEISEGTLRNVTVRASSGEILALGETFNRMVASLREKEKVEANLRQAQRLSALGNLAAGIAHDVRNPLNAIKLLTSHVLDDLNGTPDSQGAVKHLRTIRNEVNRLEEIVSGFMSLAKEEELHTQPCAVDEVLRECLLLVDKEAEEREVRLTSELRCGDTRLMLDQKHWTRAIINVLLNALETCEAGGRVRVFSRLTDRSCEIEIRDDGPGMSAETLERAFDPYFTTKKTGTGLGLSITRGIVQEHGGDVTITSTQNQGCQVLIVVPLETTAAKA